MSKTRKVLGIIMAVALVLNLTAIAVFAADDSTTTNEWTIVSDAFTTEPTLNNTFTVSVQLLADYALGPVQFALDYDSTSFGIAASGAISVAGYPYDATVQYNYDSANGLLRVVIVPDTQGLSTLPAVSLSTATTIATITLTYLAPGTIEIANDYKTDTNINGTLCAFRSLQEDLLDCEAGDLLYGQTPTITAGDHEIGTAAVTELAVIDGTGGVIDNVNMFVYGVEMTEEYQMIEDVFEATSGGYIEVDQSTYTGTGAQVYVFKADDTLVATYTFILFGDIDGDGEITAIDASVAEFHDAWNYGPTGRIEEEMFLFAGDLDGDMEITAIDASIAEFHDAWNYGPTGRLTQADVIALL
jgi:hypothetical protein